MAVYKRNGTWHYRVTYKFDTKKYRQINSKMNYRTKKEAELAESEVKQKLHKGFSVNAEQTLFVDYFEEWYEVYRKGKKSIDNDNDIRRAIDFAKENFPFTTIKELDRKTYQKALNKFGETHATATVKKHHTYMRMCIKEAIQEGIIFRDPTFNIAAIGKIQSKKESEKYLSENNSKLLIQELLKEIKPEYTSRYIILFQLATGVRFSEAIGLTWNCIDFDKFTIKINKTWDYKYTKSFSNTKTYASMRTITIDKNTINLLKQIKLAQSKAKLKGKLINKHELVFISFSKKMPVTNNAVNKTLKKFLVKIGLDDENIITSHGLRHTHASILLYRGINIKYISRRLGHKDIVTTLQTYSHVIDELEQKESRKVDDTINDLYDILL